MPSHTSAASFVSRPAAVPLAVAVLGLIGALAYAGPGAASISYVLIADGLILIAWLAACAGLGAWPVLWCLRRGKFADTSPALAAVGGIAMGQGILSLIVLGIGLAGALSKSVVLSLLLLGVALGGWWVAWYRRRGDQQIDRDDVRPDTAGDFAWRWLWLAAAPLLAAAIVAAMFPPGMLWKPEEPHGFDAVAYHLQVPREWFEAGRITPLQHNVYSYFPFGVEMHYLLAMYLKGDSTAPGGAWPAMYLCQLMHLAMTILAVVAAGGFAFRLASRAGGAVLAVLALAAVPFLAQLGPLAFNDGALLMFGTLSVGWTLLAMRASSAATDKHPPIEAFILPGLFAGFSAGVKLTGVPLFILAVPTALLAVTVWTRPRQAIAAAIVFGVAATIAFSPWLIRNLIWCGNPVFPEGLKLFGHAHFTDVQVTRWERAHSPQPEQQAVGQRLLAFATQVLGNWQFGIAVPIGLLALLFCWRRREAQFLGLLVLLHAIFWLGFTHLQGRFFLAAVPSAALILALVPWDRFSPQAARIGTGVTAAVLGVAMIWTFIPLHERLTAKLDSLQTDEGRDARGQILGIDRIDWLGMRSILASFPADDPNAKVLAVGDAQIFWYSLPMTRIQYRTPFDLPQGPDATVFTAYGSDRRDSRTWTRVDPDELMRFAQTYQPFPSVPTELKELNERSTLPYVVLPGGRLIPATEPPGAQRKQGQ